jgi:glycosyltransferase involved in cell wall biosynthesis
MTMALRPLGAARPSTMRTGLAVVVFAVLGPLLFALAIRVEVTSLLETLLAVAAVGVLAWMFLSERYAVTLAVFMLYVGLADGFLKLKTGNENVTALRDLLLVAIVAGGLARMVLRKSRVTPPPLTGWVVAFTVVVVVQLANPSTYSLTHGIAALRPHLQFVPLFFLGYAVLRTKARLRWFLILMLFVAAVNGVVSLVQFNLTPDELADWGPGYRDRIEGVGVAARTFEDESGTVRTRPFALGSDSGFGGGVAALALPGALALISLGRRRAAALVAIPLAAGAILAVVTSQGRGVVLASVAAIFAFVALAIVGRRLVPTLVAIGVGVLVTWFVISAVGGNDQAALGRYDSIAPTKALQTAQEERGGAFTIVPLYIDAFPLGAGLGSVGPAAGFGGAPDKGLSGETEFSFLLVEAGIAGLAVILLFHLRLLGLSLTGIRRTRDPELRLLLAGFAAPLFAIFFLYLGGPATASTPLAPYLWFAAGVLAYWLITARRAPSEQRVAFAHGGNPRGPSAPAGRPTSPTVAALPPSASAAPVRREQRFAPPTAPVTSQPSTLLLYGGRGERIDAIRSYTETLARTVASLGDRRVTLLLGDGPGAWTVADVGGGSRRVEFDELGRLLGAVDHVVVQYNPFSYGNRGFAPWLPRLLRQVRNADRPPALAVMVHEAFVAAGGLRSTALSVWQRNQLRAVLSAADVVFTSTEHITEQIQGSTGRSCVHLPVGSNLPDRRADREEMRRRLGIDPGTLVLAAFGTDHPSRLPTYLRGAAEAVAASGVDTVLLNLGARAPAVPTSTPGLRVITPGEQAEEDLAAHMAAGDVYLAAFEDGVSTRRTTLMAALQHELAVVGTSGVATDGMLARATHAIRLVPVGRERDFADAVVQVAADAGERAMLAQEGRALYDGEFDWPVVGSRMVALLDAAAARRRT